MKDKATATPNTITMDWGFTREEEAAFANGECDCGYPLNDAGLCEVCMEAFGIPADVAKDPDVQCRADALRKALAAGDTDKADHWEEQLRNCILWVQNGKDPTPTDEPTCDDNDNDWQREFAHQNGMAFGCAGYNDAMGF